MWIPPAGDNVEQQYVIEEAGADQPGEADWQNSDGRSLDEIVTEPEINRCDGSPMKQK